MNHALRLRNACYVTNLSMSIVANLSPLLFIIFKDLYGISYSLLGLLVTVNYVSQLLIDLIFSFYSHRFNIPKTVQSIPALTIIGLLVYALWPWLFPNHTYLGLLLGTVIFSTAGGLGEVLISPVIAALPADDPDREMSKLHSIYAWGVVFVVILSTVFLLVFRRENWQFLPMILAVIPLIALILFRKTQIPSLKDTQKSEIPLSFLKEKGLWLFVAGIFVGGAAECTMAQWSSGYLEQALGIPKVWGDLLGVTCFYIMLGTGRTLYAKKGKEIRTVLIVGAWGAAACYLLCAITPNALLGLLCCGVTGLFVSMLWPGNLIIASERYASSGVFIFAIMAAGGDLGASIGPQLVGLITDGVCASPALVSAATSLGLTADQFGMKLGILAGMCFPLCAGILYQKFYVKK